MTNKFAFAFFILCFLSGPAPAFGEVLLICNGYNIEGDGLDVEIHKMGKHFKAKVSLMEKGVTLPSETIDLLEPKTESGGRVFYQAVAQDVFQLEFIPPPEGLSTRTGQGFAYYIKSPFRKIGMGCSF